MTSHRPLLIPIIVTVAFAAVCTRLGVWQVHRLAERRAWNAHLEERLAAAPVPVTELGADSSMGHYRRVTATGRFDFEREIALATRSSQGSPGVHVLTPLRLADGSVALVNRGWVYAADAMTIDHAAWRENADSLVTVTGYAETWSGHIGAPAPRATRVVRALDSATVARLVGAPIRPFYVVQTSDSVPGPRRPVRLATPVLDEGSHRNYAIQWFSFALVALIGGSLLVREEIVRRRASA